MTYLSRTNQYSLVACTAYSDVREYDTRCPRKPVHNSKVFSQGDKDRYGLKELYLSKIFQSKINENHIYVVTQEGHPVIVDRR